MAQFLSPDPFIQAPGNWYNYNRYGYCYNNPLMYNDPSGYFIKWLGRKLNKFGRWLGKSFDNLGDFLTKNNVSIGVGVNMTPGGGPTTYNASINGRQVFNSANGNQFNPAVNVERGLNQMRMGESITSGNLAYQNAMVSEGIRNSGSMLPHASAGAVAQGGRGIEGDRFEANVWFGLGLGFDVSFFGLGGKVQANGPNVNLFNFVNGEYSTWNGVRWFNAKGGLALANLESEAFYDGKDVSMNTKLQLAATEFSTQEGVRFAPIKISYHYFIIGGDISISRHFLRAPFEYEKARQEFYENTGTPMFRR